jgi:hypothetical protein
VNEKDAYGFIKKILGDYVAEQRDEESMEEEEEEEEEIISDEARLEKWWNSNDLTSRTTRGVPVHVNNPSQDATSPIESVMDVTPISSSQLIAAATTGTSVLQPITRLAAGKWPSMVQNVKNQRKRAIGPEEGQNTIPVKQDSSTKKSKTEPAAQSIRADYALDRDSPITVLPKRDLKIPMYVTMKPQLRVYRMEIFSPALMILLTLGKYDANGFLTLLCFLFGDNFVTDYVNVLGLDALAVVGEVAQILRSAVDIDSILAASTEPLKKIVTAWPRRHNPRLQ